jgi:cyanophycinase
MSATERRRSSDRGSGHLLIIGGGEDREKDKTILSRLVELAGGTKARIVVLTAASTVQREMWKMYDRAFGDLGVSQRIHMSIGSREEAADPARADEIMAADAVFMTGGDQKRLLAMIGGTRIDSAMHRAFQMRGACIAGTSAGASAMSEHMLATSSAQKGAPAKDETHLAAGLGFLQRVVIDQHFSERHRLGRLLAIVAQNPYLLGIGIDEDTALCIESGAGLEVVGQGAVTLIDGRHMISNFLEVSEHQRMELVNVRLHLLPAGASYRLKEDAARMPAVLRDAIAAVTIVSSPASPAFPASADRRNEAREKADHGKEGRA